MRIGVLVAVLAVAGTALADDLNPPPWRGDPGSTFQHWTFDTDVTGLSSIPPDYIDNPYGTATIVDTYATSSEWWDLYMGRQGVWHAYWYFWIDIDNDPIERPYKEIQIQWTYYYDDPNGWDNGRPKPSLDWPGAPFTNTVELIDEYPLLDNWYYAIWKIMIWPNPDFESIYVVADDGYSELWFDQIVVDTICIPESATLGLIALAGLVFFRRR